MAAVLAIEIAPRTAVPAHVAKLQVTNSSVYQVNVDVSDGSEGGWLDLGSVGRARTKTLEQVTDQGPTWLFRFSYGGVDAGRLTVPRAALEAAGWKVRVPDEAADLLRAAGLAPSPFG